MTDVFPPEKRREVMRRVRSRGTEPEKEIKRMLDEMGVGYIYQAKLELDGKKRTVDFLIPSRRLVIEYRDCFWHYCSRCYKKPPVKGGIKGREWWERKLRRNRERDRELEELLKKHGYRLVVIWRHDRKRMREIIEEALRTGE